MTDECPYCKGRGHLPSSESISILAERDLRLQAVERAGNSAEERRGLRSVLAARTATTPGTFSGQDAECQSLAGCYERYSELLELQLHTLSLQPERAQAQRDALTASTCWQITAPLRVAARSVRGLLRLTSAARMRKPRRGITARHSNQKSNRSPLMTSEPAASRMLRRNTSSSRSRSTGAMPRCASATM